MTCLDCNYLEEFIITATNITSIKETKDNDSVKMGEQHGRNHMGCEDLKSITCPAFEQVWLPSHKIKTQTNCDSLTKP